MRLDTTPDKNWSCPDKLKHKIETQNWRPVPFWSKKHQKASPCNKSPGLGVNLDDEILQCKVLGFTFGADSIQQHPYLHPKKIFKELLMPCGVWASAKICRRLLAPWPGPPDPTNFNFKSGVFDSREKFRELDYHGHDRWYTEAFLLLNNRSADRRSSGLKAAEIFYQNMARHIWGPRIILAKGVTQSGQILGSFGRQVSSNPKWDTRCGYPVTVRVYM